MIKLAAVTNLLAALVLAGAANAGNITRETWKATWPGNRCTLQLTYDKADMAGDVVVEKPCGKELRKVRSFVYSDDSRSEMLLFARPGARGDIVGGFSKSGRNRMDGLIGDGVEASLFLSASSSVTMNGGINPSSNGNGGSSAGASCVQYSDRSGCADRVDTKNPRVPTFQSIEMLSLSHLKIYPFSGGNGFAKKESVAQYQCVTVKRCETASGGKGDWCEIVLSDGFFTGWVKRQDADFVYLQKGCDG